MTGSIGCTLFVFLFKSIRLLSLLDNARQLQKFQQLAQTDRFLLAILLAICPYLLAIFGKNLFFAKHPR